MVTLFSVLGEGISYFSAGYADEIQILLLLYGFLACLFYPYIALTDGWAKAAEIRTKRGEGCWDLGAGWKDSSAVLSSKGCEAWVSEGVRKVY